MSEKPPAMLLGMRVRQHRIDHGLSQQMFAQLLGTTQSNVSEIEQGKISNIRIGTVIKIAEVLQVSLDRLFGLPDLDFGLPDLDAFDDFLLELARRNTADERLAERDSVVAFTRFDSDQGMYFRGVAAGLRVAQNNQLAITQERKAADDRPVEEAPDGGR